MAKTSKSKEQVRKEQSQTKEFGKTPGYVDKKLEGPNRPSV
ncbi:hypothetical protein [Bacillus sp. HMF5848]|nr:hypothetical protein [Bacillus sp. HMF5848]